MTKEEKPLVIEYPELETINLNDPEIQKDLIRKGVAVGIPGTSIIFTEHVELVAGGNNG